MPSMPKTTLQTASRIYDMDDYQWNDLEWMERRIESLFTINR